MGPETSRGRHHPKSVFLWGSTPVSLGKTKEIGVEQQHKVKPSRTKRRVPETQRPGGDGTPPLQMRDGRGRQKTPPVGGVFGFSSSTLYLQNTPQARTCRSYSSHTWQLSQRARACSARARPRRWCQCCGWPCSMATVPPPPWSTLPSSHICHWTPLAVADAAQIGPPAPQARRSSPALPREPVYLCRPTP